MRNVKDIVVLACSRFNDLADKKKVRPIFAAAFGRDIGADPLPCVGLSTPWSVAEADEGSTRAGVQCFSIWTRW